MKKVLYVNGCSHAAGAEIAYPLSFRDPYDIKMSWGGQLAEKYNLIHENDAIPGQGNDAILSNTLNSVNRLLTQYSPAEILVIISWSGFERTNYVYNDFNYPVTAEVASLPFFKTYPRPVKLAWEAMINNSDENVTMNKFAITYLSLVTWLRSLNIEYLFFNAFQNCTVPKKNLLHQLHNNEINKSIFDMISSDNNYLNPFNKEQTYFSYLEAKGFDSHIDGRGYHYVEDGHLEWANYIENILLQQKKLSKNL